MGAPTERKMLENQKKPDFGDISEVKKEEEDFAKLD